MSSITRETNRPCKSTGWDHAGADGSIRGSRPPIQKKETLKRRGSRDISTICKKQKKNLNTHIRPRDITKPRYSDEGISIVSFIRGYLNKTAVYKGMYKDPGSSLRFCESKGIDVNTLMTTTSGVFEDFIYYLSIVSAGRSGVEA